MNPSLPVAVITGAGTGIGRAVAVKLAASGWSVALVGRRAEPLAETAALAGAAAAAFPCNITDPAAVNQMAAAVLARFGRVDALVNSAGTNTPRRSLDVLSLRDYQRLVDTNLHGAYHCLQAFLPGMRQQGAGTIVNVSSEAGRQASAKSGAAYVVSKFGLAGLTQSINAEERGRGIRACCVFPGDVDTPLLDQRPNPPPPEARSRMLAPSDVAECIELVLRLPSRAIVEEIVIRPA